MGERWRAKDGGRKMEGERWGEVSIENGMQ
jgi:hypothetical protein